MSSNLLDDIKEIINGPGEDAVKSNNIMERLRGETIFIPESYRKQKETDQFCTIDPQKCLPFHLSQLEEDTGDQCVLDMIKRGVISIKGNSFGPYFPMAFFNEETYKVLSLLKESYIEGSSFKAGDRGAHNQAAEYVAYSFEYGNLGKNTDTHPRLVEYIKQLLIYLKKLPEDCSILDVMSHICILEVNHFPGLAFNSKNSDLEKNYKKNLVAKWGRKNKGLIHTLVDFYNPSIIIFGCTLEYFEEFYDFEKVFQRYTDNNLEIFGDRIIEISYIDSVTDEKIIFREADKPTINKKIEENKKIIGKNKFNVGRNIKYLGESGRIYIQAYHPSARYGKFKPEFAIKDAEVIKEWKSLKSKEKGVKNSTTV